MLTVVRTAALLTVLLTLFAVPAIAASACQGSFTASSLRPLPQPATIELNITRPAWMGHLPSKVGSATMTLTAMLVDPKDAAFIWVGSIECVIQTTNRETLAGYIGMVIGQGLGRNFNKRMI